MRARDLAGGALKVALVVLVVSMVVGQVLGQPVLLGYVRTDSMEPALSPGDGYIAIPAFIAGPPDKGDVVVYRAKTLHGGGLTTHRIVGKRNGGYVTKGDNNPFTDQASGEPPVTRGQIVAYVVQVNGHVVAIPHLGTAASGLRSSVAAVGRGVGTERAGTVLVFGGIALFVLAGVVGNGAVRSTRRSRTRDEVVPVRTVVLTAVVIVVAATTAAMIVPAGIQEFGLVATENPPEESGVLAPGGSTEVGYTVANGGAMPVVVFVEPASRGVAVEPGRRTLAPGETASTTVTLSVPEREGRYVRHVRKSVYPLVLPPSVVAALHRIHPLLAMVAVDLVVSAFVLAAAIGVFGTDDLRVRSTSRSLPLSTRVRRRLRRML